MSFSVFFFRGKLVKQAHHKPHTIREHKTISRDTIIVIAEKYHANLFLRMFLFVGIIVAVDSRTRGRTGFTHALWYDGGGSLTKRCQGIQARFLTKKTTCGVRVVPNGHACEKRCCLCRKMLSLHVSSQRSCTFFPVHLKLIFRENKQKYLKKRKAAADHGVTEEVHGLAFRYLVFRVQCDTCGCLKMAPVCWHRDKEDEKISTVVVVHWFAARAGYLRRCHDDFPRRCWCHHRSGATR